MGERREGLQDFRFSISKTAVGPGVDGGCLYPASTKGLGDRQEKNLSFPQWCGRTAPGARLRWNCALLSRLCLERAWFYCCEIVLDAQVSLPI